MIEIQAPTETVDELGTGVPNLTWITAARAWASIVPLTGAEYTNANQQQAAVTHVVTIRYPGLAVTPRHRLKFGERVFEIVAALDTDERNVEVVIQAKERAA